MVAEVIVRSTKTTPAQVAGLSLTVLHLATCVELLAWLMMGWVVRLAGALSHFQPISVLQSQPQLLIFLGSHLHR